MSVTLSGPAIQACQVGTVVLAGPGISGFIARVEARLQGRVGSRVMQPYYDIAKLFRKESLAPDDASPLFLLAPFIAFACYLTVPLLIPVLTSYGLPLGYMGDILGGGFLLALASFMVSLAAADGSPRGSATFTDGAQGVAVQVTAAGLPAGEHGIHVHTVGRCDPPKFETAGAHWNPTNKQHGRDNPQGAHAGDMPNLTIGADGSGTASFTLAGESLAQLLDADGAALVIHAKPDDYKTDPSGDSGDRVACGVVTKS